MAQGMAKHSKLDNPRVAAHAWAHYWRLMRWMAGLAVGAAIVAIAGLWWRNPDASVHLFIAAAAGVIFSVMLAAALMGLVFLSSGTGHDEAIDDLLEEERNRP